tara:strand:+ start:2707 stop:3333 length:627 start_codon:yes stop_codon:yes gene_type:complete
MAKNKSRVYIYSNGMETEYEVEDYQDLDNESILGKQAMSLERTKEKVLELNEDAFEYEQEIEEIESVDKLADFLYENDLTEIFNTYNDSWWGGTRQYMVLKNFGNSIDYESETVLFMSFHRGGDARGNYEEYEAFTIDDYFYEEFPVLIDKKYIEITDDKGNKFVAESDDLEGYYYYVQEDEIGKYEEGDTVNTDQIEESYEVKNLYD